MLTNCNHCAYGLLLPMLDISNVYHSGISLFLHKVPYTVCTHCNTRHYPNLAGHNDLAKKIYDQYGITSFQYEQYGIAPYATNQEAESGEEGEHRFFEPLFLRKVVFCLGAVSAFTIVTLFIHKKVNSCTKINQLKAIPYTIENQKRKRSRIR